MIWGVTKAGTKSIKNIPPRPPYSVSTPPKPKESVETTKVEDESDVMDTPLLEDSIERSSAKEDWTPGTIIRF